MGQAGDQMLFRNVLFHGILLMGRTNLAPLYWHRSKVVGFDKQDGMAAAAGRRAILCLAKLRIRARTAARGSDHGISGAQLASGAWGWSFAVAMNDLQNAFGSVSWQALDKSAGENADMQDEDLCKQ
eukprot:9293896-Pyramimonas_sp.AAC.1